MSEKTRACVGCAALSFVKLLLFFFRVKNFRSFDLLCKKCLCGWGADVAVVVWCGVSVFIGKCVRVYDVVKMAFSCPLLVDCLDEMPNI